MQKYKFIVCGYMHQNWLPSCLESIDQQVYRDFQVCVVDDATPDPGFRQWIKDYCEARGWLYMLNETNMGAMYNQVHAIRMMDPHPEDVLVFVDGDDRLADNQVLTYLNEEYADGTRLTYGQYTSEPFSPTCTPSYAYPQEIIDRNDYRLFASQGGGLRFNHLRTLKHELFAQCDDTDFKDAEGNWFVTGTDAAIMLPCMKLARGKIKCLDRVLYVYRSDSPLADWRIRPNECNSNHWYMLNVLRKKV